jgi:hypothetical protein
MEGTDYAVFFLAVIVEVLGGVLDRFSWWFFGLRIGGWDTGWSGMRNVVRLFRKMSWFLARYS